MWLIGGGTMITIDMIVDEINRYDDNVIKTFPGIGSNEVKELERKLGYALPTNFCAFLMKCNGFELISEIIYGIHTDESLDITVRALDLYKNYIWEKDEVGNPIWSHLLPISPDGFGNHYCLDLDTLTEDNSECKVVFWQHDYEFSKDNPPPVDAETVLEFLWKLLQEIKEIINYDGTDK
jgi:cell wall assembly regulator SMI1